MQAPENLTQISGRIVARKPHPSLRDYDTVTVHIESAGPVQGIAQILKPEPGKQIDVTVRRELLGDVAAGARLECRIKHTLNGPMCEPHPEEDHFFAG